jgi:glycosyltransferase domain-containing protein
MFSASQSDCTVVIPTFNRPAELGMLLRYLAHHEAGFPIVVLDASDEEFRERNAAAVAGWPLNADIRAFAARLPFYETVAAGVAAVETPYCAIIPDDDLVLPDGFGMALEFLRRHADFAAAQGYHLSFIPDQDGIRLLDIAEWCPGIEDERPLVRLYRYARRYQPVVYGVYRTAVLNHSFAAVLCLGNPMLRELAQALLTVAQGKIARLPLLHRLRRDDQSVIARERLHVFWQFLADPEQLMRDYVPYRALLLEAFTGAETGFGPAEVKRVIDLVHGHYFHRHADPGILEFMLQKSLALLSPDELTAGEASLRLQRSTPPDPALTLNEKTITGGKRRLWIEAALVNALGNPEICLDMSEIRRAVRELAAYC